MEQPFINLKKKQALKRKSFRGSEVQGEFTKAIDISGLAPGEYVELILPMFHFGLLVQQIELRFFR